MRSARPQAGAALSAVRLAAQVRSFATAKKDPDAWRKSTVPTMHFQPSLPRLPIPELKETLDKYLAAVLPLLPALSQASTKAAVESFRANEGPELQKKLVQNDHDNKHTSYISEPWFDMYLRNRMPVSVHSNPFLTFNDDPSKTGQAERATSFVVSALRFRHALRNNTLSPEVYHTKPQWSESRFFKNFVGMLPAKISWYGAYLFGAYPLDMVQYTRLFKTTRVPVVDKDVLRAFPEEKNEHVLVTYRGHFYRVNVGSSAGDDKPTAEALRSAFDAILASSPEPAKHPLAALTTEDRNVWAEQRLHFMANTANHALLNAIDSALFVVSLDDSSPTADLEMPKTFLCGTPGTRWFDKSFSIIVCKNGVSGVNFEHAWGDGVAVMRFINEVYADSKAAKPVQATQKTDVETLKLPAPVCDEKGAAAIDAAVVKFQGLSDSLKFGMMQRSGIGKNLFKKCKISPDGGIQMAFQLAYWRMTHKTVATYESCSTAAFRHGRTETIRPVSYESVAFVKVFDDQSASASAKASAFRAAVAVHSARIKDAAMGKGFDRHMFALKNLSPANALPAIFTDPAYALINHNILSTSTLVSDAVKMGGFAPVVPDGLGVGYSVLNDSCGAIVSSFIGDTHVNDFLRHLERALDDIAEALRADKAAADAQKAQKQK